MVRKNTAEETAAASRQKWQEAHLPCIAKEHADTEHFRDLVPRVARVLANIPTYMTFDDHEITDDWNISKKWINRVYSYPRQTENEHDDRLRVGTGRRCSALSNPI